MAKPRLAIAAAALVIAGSLGGPAHAQEEARPVPARQQWSV